MKGVIGCSGNNGIVVNLPGTILVNVPQCTRRSGLEIFDSVVEIYCFSKNSTPWDDESISENYG